MKIILSKSALARNSCNAQNGKKGAPLRPQPRKRRPGLVFQKTRGGPHGSAWRFTSVGAAGLHKKWIVVLDLLPGLSSLSGFFDHGRLARKARFFFMAPALQRKNVFFFRFAHFLERGKRGLWPTVDGIIVASKHQVSTGNIYSVNCLNEVPNQN